MLEECKLKLDDPIEKYLEGYKHAGKEVTIRRILNHTSGIRHYGKGDRMIDIKNYQTTSKALKIFIGDDLESKPGTTYKYSTHAFTILAAIVQKVSGMVYTGYLSNVFFELLGMNRRSPEVKGAADDNQTTLHNGLKKVRLVDNPSYKRAGGAMLSTAESLVKIGETHLQTRFDQQCTLDSMFKPTAEITGA